MKIKTQDLKAEDGTLDWSVAKCEGYVARGAVKIYGNKICIPNTSGAASTYAPSTDWAQGEPIIDRANIALRPVFHAERTESGIARRDGWAAHVVPKATRWGDQTALRPFVGSTLLIAAMRCFVDSRLGSEVEVPDALVPHLVAQHAAKKDSGADPDIYNKWVHVQTYGNYVNFDKNTSSGLGMSFDTENHTCYYTIKLHNDDCETRDWEKVHRIPWSMGIAMLVADGVEVPAVLMAQSAQEGPGGADDSASAHQPIDRPRG